MIDIRIGDSRKLIHELPDKSIDCVVTSPPYWGLRDYGHPDQIGLEKTPEEYLKTMLDFFDDVKRKLKDEGNVFVNLGDTYAGSWGNYGNRPEVTGKTDNQRLKETDYFERGGIGIDVRPGSSIKHPVIKPKSLCLIPQRFAIGMVERGWIVRNEIVWAKPNHVPESVTDRLTKAHEVIWHFVKQQRYYYNLDAIREPHSFNRWSMSNKIGSNKAKTAAPGQTQHSWQRKGHSGYYDDEGNLLVNPLGKNPGDVWTIVLKPYSEAHFAVFPLELVRRPILAGCPVGGTVLDPFSGSGTVGEFCRYNERNAILFELNPEYRRLIDERTMNHTPSLEIYEANQP